MNSKTLKTQAGLTRNNPKTNNIMFVTQCMMKHIWYYTDIQIPNVTSLSNYLPLIKKYSLGYNIPEILSLINVIDFTVESLIDYSTSKVIESFEGNPMYDDLKLFIHLQAASEIIHQKSYTIQFNLVTREEDREHLITKAISYVDQLTVLAKDYSDEQKYGVKAHKLNVILCSTIEVIVIPLIFNIICHIKKSINSRYDTKIEDEELANKVITAITQANRMITRDELDHIKGGCYIIRQLYEEGITEEDVKSVVGKVKGVVNNWLPYMMDHTTTVIVDDEIVVVDLIKKSNQVMNTMEEIYYRMIKGEEVDLTQYEDLDMLLALLPSIEGQFRGTTTNYETRAVVYIDNPELL
jgi:hypothetical protein